MKLAFSPGSPFARKVRIAAIELGLIDKIELIPTTLAPAQPNDEYSRINPVKRLPALVTDNGEVIVDSYVIVEYLDDLAGGGKLIPASGSMRWKVKSDHSLLQGTLDSMLLCRYEKMVRPQELRWQAWADDHWNRAWNGMAHFEKQAEMLSRPLDIAQIALTCVLGYADFRFADCGWRKAYPALDAQDLLILCFQSYVVKTPHHTILVDSCIGNDKPRPTRPKWNMKTDDTYMRALAAAGISVGDIDFVMCTHLHVDHVGWNTRLENGRWAPTFPNARYVFARNEFDYWTEQHAKTPVPPFNDSVLPVLEAKRADIVGNDYEIGDHARILPTPGHTPGHVAFTFGRGRDDAVVGGDLMHSPLQARYPELSMKFDVDQAQAAGTRRDFLERYCDTDTLCCTAHFPSPSTGKIRRWGNGFSCEAI